MNKQCECIGAINKYLDTIYEEVEPWYSLAFGGGLSTMTVTHLKAKLKGKKQFKKSVIHHLYCPFCGKWQGVVENKYKGKSYPEIFIPESLEDYKKLKNKQRHGSK